MILNWKTEYEKKLVSLEEAASIVKSGDKIVAGPAASFPLELINAVSGRDDIKDVDLYSALITTLPDFINPDQGGRINYYPLFMGPLERGLFQTGCVTPISLHFSKMVEYFHKMEIDAVFFEVSPPNEFGYMSLGPCTPMVGRSVCKTAKKIIVQVNPNVPFIYGGDPHIHVNEVDLFCEVDRPLFEVPEMPVSDIEKQIASYIVPLIEDRATVQLGIGQLANAIGENLYEKKDLGIHTEVLTSSIINLFDKGVITGKYKNINKGKMVSAFMLGNRKDYRFINNNTAVEMYSTEYVNDPLVIAQNDNVISINNALSIDLTGQVSSESMGFTPFSGTGGQVDFVRGARMSKGGKSFIALQSTAKKGTISRIKLSLDPGTAVTTPRSDVQYVVTEYGIADLDQKTIPERTIEMIKIAHPDFREELAKGAVENKLITAAQSAKI